MTVATGERAVARRLTNLERIATPPRDKTWSLYGATRHVRFSGRYQGQSGSLFATQMSAFDGGFNRSTQHLLIVSDWEVAMEGNARIRFTPRQRAELWERWKNGQCVADIARALERRNKSGVYRVLALNGGIAPAPRRRAARTLRLAEREEISRGIAAGWSMRRIAHGLGRSPSTVSREISRNGGGNTYRANWADRQAW